MSEYTKEQEAEALRVLALGSRTERVLAIVFAMAKRTAEAEATLVQRETALLDRLDTIVRVTAERDALKARVAELEAKAAQSPFGPSVDPIEAARGVAEIQRAMSPSPTVVVTREMVEALSEFARTWARFGADCEPENAAARLVVALGEALEVKP